MEAKQQALETIKKNETEYCVLLEETLPPIEQILGEINE